MRSWIASSVLAATLCAAAPTTNGNAFNVPVSRRQPVARANGQVDPELYFGALQWTIQKYDPSFKLPFTVTDIIGKRATANEPLKAFVSGGVEQDYYGPVTVGASTPQTFQCDFDTGSADFFVPGPQCGQAQGCPGSTKYDQGGTDEDNTTTVTYGSGQITGENYFDSVEVAGLTAKNQNVISLTQAQGFSTGGFSSLMGMAFSTIANSKQPTYFENLISQKVVTTPEFGFFLGRAADGNAQNSELTLGGRDTSKYTGAVYQIPVTQVGYWQVALDNVVANGKSVALTAGQAAIDTGTTLVLAPNAATTNIYANIPGSFPTTLGGTGVTLWAYPCSANPKVSIVFNGHSFAIDPRDFNFGSLTSAFADFINQVSLVQKLTGGNYCLGAIAGADVDPTQNLYIVGDTFLKNWYSIYNYVNAGGKPSVSFAKSI